jgi:hypothetical protein
MTYETYFPEQRHLLQQATFRRDRLLPNEASGVLEIGRGDRVDLRTVVARGEATAPYTILDVVKALKLRSVDDVEKVLKVGVGDTVTQNEMLASKDKRNRKGLRSPIDGTVAYISAGRIILRAHSDPMQVEAGMTGQVVEIRRGRGALIEGLGAVMQGVWGNGKRGIGIIRLEPEDGLEHIYGSEFESPFRGAIVVTKRSLRRTSLDVMADQGLAGIIAPSIEPELVQAALESPRAILLTEGFGQQRMGGAVYQFLVGLQGQQATIDGVLPGVLEARRPEVIVKVPINPGERPPAARIDTVLQRNMQVRLTRGDFAGNMGEVVDLPQNTVLLENGLRVFCAQVKLLTGETVNVPLENLEVFG